MEKVTENVYAETKLRGCNPGYVVTSDGVVVIDTPQLPTYAVKMREEVEKRGPIRYIINTEHHIDHIFGNYYFKGAGVVISHADVYDNFMKVTPELNPYDYAKEAIPTDDPEGEAIFPDEETYFQDPNKPTIHRGTRTGRSPCIFRRRGWCFRAIPFSTDARPGTWSPTSMHGSILWISSRPWMWITLCPGMDQSVRKKKSKSRRRLSMNGLRRCPWVLPRVGARKSV